MLGRVQGLTRCMQQMKFSKQIELNFHFFHGTYLLAAESFLLLFSFGDFLL